MLRNTTAFTYLRSGRWRAGWPAFHEVRQLQRHLAAALAPSTSSMRAKCGVVIKGKPLVSPAAMKCICTNCFPSRACLRILRGF